MEASENIMEEKLKAADYLMTKFMAENPSVLDDDMPEAYENWLVYKFDVLDLDAGNEDAETVLFNHYMKTNA